MSVRLRPQVRIDILELAERIGEDYPGAALAFLKRLDETIELLERFPRIGANSPFPLPVDPEIASFRSKGSATI